MASVVASVFDSRSEGPGFESQRHKIVEIITDGNLFVFLVKASALRTNKWHC